MVQRLEALGFKVLNVPNPDRTRDEIVLACEIVEANGWKQVDANDLRFQALSELLQSPVIHPATPRNPDFRNPSGVAFKTYNIASTHPAYRGAQSNGNRLDKEVLDDFRADPARMHAMAARIRELLTRDEASSTDLPDLDPADIAAGEGSLVLRAHLRRERDPKLRRKKLDDIKRRGLPIAYDVCTSDFGHTYGSHGLDYIECHHRPPTCHRRNPDQADGPGPALLELPPDNPSHQAMAHGGGVEELRCHAEATGIGRIGRLDAEVKQLLGRLSAQTW